MCFALRPSEHVTSEGLSLTFMFLLYTLQLGTVFRNDVMYRSPEVSEGVSLLVNGRSIWVVEKEGARTATRGPYRFPPKR